MPEALCAWSFACDVSFSGTTSPRVSNQGSTENLKFAHNEHPLSCSRFLSPDTRRLRLDQPAHRPGGLLAGGSGGFDQDPGRPDSCRRRNPRAFSGRRLGQPLPDGCRLHLGRGCGRELRRRAELRVSLGSLRAQAAHDVGAEERHRVRLPRRATTACSVSASLVANQARRIFGVDKNHSRAMTHLVRGQTPGTDPFNILTTPSPHFYAGFLHFLLCDPRDNRLYREEPVRPAQEWPEYGPPQVGRLSIWRRFCSKCTDVVANSSGS